MEVEGRVVHGVDKGRFDNQTATGAKHADSLRNRFVRIGHVLEHVEHQYGIESPIREWEVLGIAIDVRLGMVKMRSGRQVIQADIAA